MYRSSRQANSLTRSAFSVQDALVYPMVKAKFGTPLSIMPL
jgi:hypothetical protein